ncbi:MAG: aminotransferase class I/II-fold pyridoxal phosphate-dependent enzyme [Caldilineaceae bacterium]
MKDLSQLIGAVPGSVTAMMMEEGRELAAAGVDVINLAGGEPFQHAGPHHSTRRTKPCWRATPTIRPRLGRPNCWTRSWASWRENNVHVTRDQILVTPGAKWAIYATLAVTTNPGDEVLVLDPAWVSYGPMVQLQQATPVHVTLRADDSASRPTQRYVAAPSSSWSTTPATPPGRCCRHGSTPSFRSRPQSLRAQRRDHEHIIYGAVHHSLAVEPGMAERTIIVNGFSEACDDRVAQAGWRAAGELARTLQTRASPRRQLRRRGCGRAQRPPECVHEITAYQRVALHARRAGRSTGIECAPIEGAFVFPKFTATERAALANILLEDGLIATPGIAFGHGNCSGTGKETPRRRPSASSFATLWGTTTFPNRVGNRAR